MKYILTALLFIVIGLISYGFYIVNSDMGKGNLIIGVGVVILGFVLMPLFIYHRYKDKDIKDFQLKNFADELHKQSKKE